MNQHISQSDLKAALSYDPETGIFRWMKRLSIRVVVGQIAGTPNGNGYIRIVAHGKKYHAHRLAFLYMTGDFPAEDVDHINGDRSDNRWANLRPVSHQRNCTNQRPRAKAVAAPVGIHWNKAKSLWQADIRVNGKSLALGRFSILEDAVKARKDAEARFGFHENHGKIVQGLANRRADERANCI